MNRCYSLTANKGEKKTCYSMLIKTDLHDNGCYKLDVYIPQNNYSTDPDDTTYPDNDSDNEPTYIYMNKNDNGQYIGEKEINGIEWIENPCIYHKGGASSFIFVGCSAVKANGITHGSCVIKIDVMYDFYNGHITEIMGIDSILDIPNAFPHNDNIEMSTACMNIGSDGKIYTAHRFHKFRFDPDFFYSYEEVTELFHFGGSPDEDMTRLDMIDGEMSSGETLGEMLPSIPSGVKVPPIMLLSGTGNYIICSEYRRQSFIGNKNAYTLDNSLVTEGMECNIIAGDMVHGGEAEPVLLTELAGELNIVGDDYIGDISVHHFDPLWYGEDDNCTWEGFPSWQWENKWKIYNHLTYPLIKSIDGESVSPLNGYNVHYLYGKYGDVYIINEMSTGHSFSVHVGLKDSAISLLYESVEIVGGLVRSRTSEKICNVDVNGQDPRYDVMNRTSFYSGKYLLAYGGLVDMHNKVSVFAEENKNCPCLVGDTLVYAKTSEGNGLSIQIKLASSMFNQ